MTEIEMRDLLSHLSKRERYVVEARTLQGKTLATIGEALGLTRERVRQIEGAGLKKMRDLLREREKPPAVSREFVAQTQRRAHRQELLHRTRRARKWVASIGRSFNVAHYVICRPGGEQAKARLAKAGIEATVYPAIAPVEGSCGAAMAPLARFNGERIPRRAADHGALLSHMGVVGAGRASGAEWVGVWEEDVVPGEGVGWQELALPADCGVVYLGGILWRDAREYGEPLGAGLWRLTQPMAISCTHAVLIHRSAVVDVMNSYATMAMAVDDLLSVACARALASGSWSTCFVQPWLAWQVDRRETWPRELVDAVSGSR